MHSGRLMRVNTAAVVGLLALAPRTAAAEGALAVGMPADVARMGFAYGSSLDSATMEVARKGAIDGCRGALGNASAELRKLCKVVATFRNQCFAVAMDPKDGTPGVEPAGEQCRTTAGASRREFCTLDVQPGARSRGCDGAAK